MDHNNFDSQWTVYATNSLSPKNHRSSVGPLVAGGLVATGAVLSMPTSASASIIYSAVNQSISWSNTVDASATYHLALPGGSGLRFEGYFIKSTGLLHGQGGTGNVGGAKAVAGHFITFGTSTHGVQKFHFGAAISAVANFQNVANFNTFQAPLNVVSGPRGFGSWANNQSNLYAGFKISSTQGLGYNGDLGYIALEVINNAGNPAYANELGIIGYAYNTTPGASITAGELPPPPPLTGVPEASNTATALLLLACAGGSLTSWRRRKQAAA